MSKAIISTAEPLPRLALFLLDDEVEISRSGVEREPEAHIRIPAERIEWLIGALQGVAALVERERRG